MTAALALVALGAAACTSGAPEAGSDGPSPAPSRESPPPLVDPSQIVSGGPPPDGIPPIDEPKFEPASAVTSLVDKEPVIAVEIGGDARAYPAQVLLWHEIVNDTVGDVPVAVTYCPLCNTGIVFERPTIDGELLDFGTSGKLYHSNLVMYDRQTESYWPQALGQAVTGPLTGTELDLVPAQMLSWEDWRRANPDGKVLTRDTGDRRSYGTNPYVGYDQPGSRPFLFDGDIDPRLQPMERVLGVRVGKHAVAFPYGELRSDTGWGSGRARVGGRSVVVFWKAGTLSAVDAATIADSRDVGATGAFDPHVDGRVLTFQAGNEGIVDVETGSRWDLLGRAFEGPLAGRELDRVVGIESFWFDWAAFFPTTDIYRA